MKAFLLCLILLHLPHFSSARPMGHETGHGGVGVVCRTGDEFGTILHSQLFDLWEAEQNSPLNLGFAIHRSDETYELQIDRAIEKLRAIDTHFAKLVQDALDEIKSHQFIMQGDLPETDDLDPRVIPEPPSLCMLEQLGVYEEDGTDTLGLFISLDVYDTLISETDKAAFFVHEAIYKVLRSPNYGFRFIDTRTGRATTLGATSRATRKLVAFLFSELSAEQKVALVSPPEEAIRCTGTYFDFAAIPGESGLSLYMTRIGIPLLSQTQVEVPPASELSSANWQGEILSSLELLGKGAVLTLEKTNSSNEYLARSTGGELEVRSDLVRCSKPLTQLN